MNNIVVSNLDEGAVQAQKFLESTLSNGANVATKLTQVINSVRENWIGADATKNINALIKIHENLYDSTVASAEISRKALTSMRVLQMVRDANMGNSHGAIAGNNGQEVTALDGDSRTIDLVPEATSVDLKPEGAEADLESLKSVKTEYENFVDTYKSEKESLISIWTAGAGYDGFVETVNSFIQYAENTAVPAINDAITNLTTVIENYKTAQAQTAAQF